MRIRFVINMKFLKMQKIVASFIHWVKSLLIKIFKKYDGRWAYIITSAIALALFIGGIKLFVELTEELKTTILASSDTAISAYITGFRTPYLTKYFVFVTNLGDALGYLVVFAICTIVFYIAFKRWRYVAQLAFVMVLALSSNLILKQIINRARPEAEHLVSVETLSYPSGHAMMAMAFYGTLLFLISQFPIGKVFKITFITMCAILILSIGISRIYLGVHYPSDIAGGYIAGFVWVVFCVMVFNLIQIFKRDPAT